MADAHYLSDKDGKKFYPYAHASATYDNNGNTVENRLKALDKTTASAVQSVKIGTTEYKSGTTVTLPSYPTSLPASDVPSWAKQKTKPTYSASEIGLGNVGNFKAVSTVASQGLTDTEKSNARANIGAQVAGSYASANHNHDDKYQAKGSYASASHTHDDRYYTETEINTKLNGKANSSHTHGNGDITSLDASKITSGTISIDRLPQGALERLTVVADDTARFKLTSSTIQKGDTVKVTSTGKMYYVVDETKLSTEAGYEVYAAGTAASVPWSGVTGKPSTYTPSSHTHDDRYYTESEIDSKLSGKANSSHTHTKSEVGLGNVDNTADSAKSVKYATNAGSASKVNGHTINSDVPTNAKFTDTTYSSKAAASGGTDVSLVTTGEKAIWNAKTSNIGTITGIKMNGASKGTSGVVDLGTVLTGGKQSTTSTADGGSNVYTFSDGSTITVKNGSKGSTGATGKNGSNGTNGTSAVWFTGTAVTGTSTSAISVSVSGSKTGDMYLNTSTANVYRASAANSWIYVCNIKGAQGARGATGSSGTAGKNGTNGVTPTIKVASGTAIGSVGTPSVTASTSGTTTTFTFNYLKGAKGDKGDPGTNATTTAVATTSANGLMSKDMVTKLNGIASGATAVTSTTVSNWGFKKTDTNTWRGVQNNLTSTATDQSLSAYQGKVLRDMIHRVIVQSSEPTISTNDEWLLEY